MIDHGIGLAVLVVIILIVAVIVWPTPQTFANSSYNGSPGAPGDLNAPADEGTFGMDAIWYNTPSSLSVACAGTSCSIRNKDQPPPHVYNNAASYYVFGPQNPPFLTWLREGMVTNNRDAINEYLDASIGGAMQPWGPRNNLMRNRRSGMAPLVQTPISLGAIAARGGAS
jgi:hypothetical protein